MTTPDVLPDDWWGIAGLIIIVFGTTISRQMLKGGTEKEKKDNGAESRLQFLIDGFNKQLEDLRAEMEEGFAVRDKRIDDLEAARDESERKNHAWQQRDADWRRRHPETAPLIVKPPVLRPDLPDV